MSAYEEIEVSYADTPNLDAAGRLRVSEKNTQIDIKQLHDQQPLLIDIVTSNATATHVPADAETTLATTAINGYAIAQTKQRFNYQSGKSQLIEMTVDNFLATDSSHISRVGYFSDSPTAPHNTATDGVFFSSGNGLVAIEIYKSGVQTLGVLQSSWNKDKLDGTGASGITADWTKNQVLIIDFLWLGINRVKFMVKYGSKVIVIHEAVFDNTTSGVYMSSPNQPLRWECRQGGGAVANTFKYICASVSSEGSTNVIGKEGGIDDNGTHLNANSTGQWYYAIGLRLQAAKLDSFIDILNAGLLPDTNDKYLFRILLNPTYNGTVTYTDVTNYAVSYGLGATANTITANGHILASGGGTDTESKDLSINSAIRLGAKIDGTLDEIVVVVKPLSSNLDIHRTLTWRERT